MKLLELKTKLLVLGCSVGRGVHFPENIYPNKHFLYKHTSYDEQKNIPFDIIIREQDEQCISRLRYNPESMLKIISDNNRYYLDDLSSSLRFEIDFVPLPDFMEAKTVDGKKIGKMCSLLGTDLLGIIPSNFCFYFSNKMECRFCELISSFSKVVENERAIKTLNEIVSAASYVLEKSKEIKNIAITTGNEKTYDYTFRKCCNFFNSIESELLRGVKNRLITSMPPEDLKLLKLMRDSNVDKVYFPIEVFQQDLFSKICPGKAKFGYQKIVRALEESLEILGEGNVYTNMVYGIQSLDQETLSGRTYKKEKENDLCLQATEFWLSKKILPAFTIYHYAGYNDIGQIDLNWESTFSFFQEWGDLVRSSELINGNFIFNELSLSNVLVNDAVNFVS